ncbi:MAG: hypothetical protein WCK63_07075 [Betaproteobacteria bacterium]
MENKIVDHKIVIRKATEFGGCRWTPILPPKPDQENKPNSGYVTLNSERASYFEFTLQAEVHES